MAGPTLLDLENIFKTSTENISYAFTGRSLGMLMGPVLAGFLYEKYSIWALLMVSTFFVSVACTILPWLCHVFVLGMVFVIQGGAMLVLSTGKSWHA